ncbi:MAG: two-component regulator propeller domain-containing protein [Bacteroidota bacterium]
MKKIIAAVIGTLLLCSINLVNAQFLTTHYYTGNCAIASDYVMGGVAVDTNNNKWFGTDQGVVKYNGSTWATYTTADGLPVNIISCIAVDKNNNIWIGTDGDGVAKFNGSTWTKYTTADGLCDNGIRYVAGDINGDVWFGSGGAGVSKLSGATWTTYTTGLPMNGGIYAAVNFITVDNSGTKWFGTDAGVAKFNGTTWTVIDQSVEDSLVDNGITSIAIDAANNKWIGTLSGITKLNSSDVWVKNYRPIDGMYNNGLRDLDIDVNGKLWMGLYTDYNNNGGITRFDGTSWTSQQFDFPDSVSADWIFRLAVDKNNDVWVAMDYGVIKIDHTSSISENQQSGALNVFPNPVSDRITLNLDINSCQKDQLVQIYNAVQKVKEVNMPAFMASTTIPVDDLPCGLYFVRVGNLTNKIIISR